MGQRFLVTFIPTNLNEFYIDQDDRDDKIKYMIEWGDSIVETTIIVNPVLFSSKEMLICESDSILIGSAYRKTAGIYTL